MPKYKSSLHLVIGLIIIAVVVLGAALFMIKGSSDKPGPERTWPEEVDSFPGDGRHGGENFECPTDAKLCPDGSSVGRTGPNCVFKNCPQDGEVSQENSQNDALSNQIVLSTPSSGSVVTSPLRLEGEARGTWFFEAVFPVVLLDANGTVLAQSFASAVLDPDDPESTWMTEDFVSFTSEFSFTSSQTADGVLVLQKDNPSGLPEFDDELRVPVRFE